MILTTDSAEVVIFAVCPHPFTAFIHHKIADIVPHVPPMSFGFEHVRNEAYYSGDSAGAYVTCEAPEGKQCADSRILSLSTADHLSYMGIAISGCPV